MFNCFFNNPILPTAFLQSLSYEEQILQLAYEIYSMKQLYENELSEEIRKYIDETFNNLMFEAIYEPETETIVLRRKKQ